MITQALSDQAVLAMNEAGFEALDEHRPFSSTEHKLVRYTGTDPKIIDLLIEQLTRVGN